MQDRRTFLELAAASLLPPGLDAQAPAPRPRGELARHALTGPLEGFEVVLGEFELPYRETTPAHRHPGVVLGYVLDGQMRFAINHDAVQIVPTGGTFFEPVGAVHTTNSAVSPDLPGRFLAFFIVPSGSSLVSA